MIGNSISPIFAEAIITLIASKLDPAEKPQAKFYSIGGQPNARETIATDVACAKYEHLA